MQTFLRFSPAEYDAIALVCRPLDPNRFPPHKLRRLLVEALGRSQPALAERLAHLKPVQVLILHQHFWGTPRPAGQECLTAREVEALTDAFGPLLLHCRFARPLKQALVRHLLRGASDLAEKVHRLSLAEFEKLCQQVKGRLGGDA
jgi:hypothetical protein